MTLRALIFDVDGTLADTEEQHRLAFNAAFAELELGWSWDRALYRELLQVAGGKERIAAYAARLGGAPAERIAAIHAAKTRHYVAAVAAGAVPLRPGVAALLDEAAAAGLLLAIASTTSRVNVAALLGERLGRFAAIAAGDEVAHKKPAPDIYDLALRRLAVAPADAVAFEDSGLGLRAALAAGLWTVITPTCWTAGDVFDGAGLVRESLEGVTVERLRSAQRAAPAGL